MWKGGMVVSLAPTDDLRSAWTFTAGRKVVNLYESFLGEVLASCPD